MGAKRRSEKQGKAEDEEEERPSKTGDKTPGLVEEQEKMLGEHDAEPPREDKRGRPQPADPSSAPDDDDEPEDGEKQDREDRDEGG